MFLGQTCFVSDFDVLQAQSWLDESCYREVDGMQSEAYDEHCCEKVCHVQVLLFVINVARNAHLESHHTVERQAYRVDKDLCKVVQEE